MWKPGTQKPKAKSSKTSKPESSGLSMSAEKTTSQKKPTSSSKKRLSGATMNMRFMKRKKDSHEQEEKQEEVVVEMQSPISSHAAVAAAPLQQDDSMDVDNDQNNKTFLIATPVDMYGLKGSITGRRSFGGFNSHMEEVWKNSKAAIQNESIDPKKKISDEELLRQYEALVKDGSGSSRPIGNLNGKSKRKPKR
eukprot:scaffold22672_cov141-Cylindrotheca_fusiformis.AAC.15